MIFDIIHVTGLQFPPQPTLEAAHTVHDPGDVEEGQSDVLLNKTHWGHYGGQIISNITFDT